MSTPTAEELLESLKAETQHDVPMGTGFWRAVAIGAVQRLADALAEVERLRAFRRDLYWAIDLIDMYDRRMIQLGDDPVLVHSAVHLEKKRAVRALLSDDAAEIVDQAFARIDRKTSAGRAEALDCVHCGCTKARCEDLAERLATALAEIERLKALLEKRDDPSS